jgi:putative Ca2+/H+ antiporter (TMEM165/GDT1 family)
VNNDEAKRTDLRAQTTGERRFLSRPIVRSLLASFYWVALVFYGAVVAIIMCFTIAVALKLAMVSFTPQTTPTIAAIIIVASILLGIIAARRNHHRLQRRELKSRNA